MQSNYNKPKLRTLTKFIPDWRSQLNYAVPKIITKLDIYLLINNAKRNSEGKCLIGNSYLNKNKVCCCWNNEQLRNIYKYFMDYLNVIKRVCIL